MTTQELLRRIQERVAERRVAKLLEMSRYQGKMRRYFKTQ